MTLYRILRPLLFALPPEQSHAVALSCLNFLQQRNLLSKRSMRKLFGLPGTIADLPTKCCNLAFPNPVGLAAGLDKQGLYLDALAQLGLGFIEVGTVTPKPQSGNPKPRLFRLPKALALINRFGFNSQGVDVVVDNIKRSSYQGILGINIGKNKNTPTEHAAQDYSYCLQRVYPFADYITINISSPNTENLRDLQSKSWLNHLLTTIKTDQQRLADTHGKWVGLWVKVAPDLEPQQIEVMAQLLLQHNIEAVIVANTTTDKSAVAKLSYGQEQGGLSGAPLLNVSNRTLELFHQHLGQKIPLIGSGGIMSGQDALTKFDRGADLVQIYTGLIYRGPQLVADILQCLQGTQQRT